MKRTISTIAILAVLSLAACSGAGDSGSGSSISNTGSVSWARTIDSGTLATTFQGLCLDDASNIIAVGTVTGTSSFSLGSSISASGGCSTTSSLIAKYQSDGTPLWAKTATTGVSARFASVASDSDGNLYAAGSMSGTGLYTFSDTVSLNGKGSVASILLVKYDTDGNCLWAKTIVSGGSDSGLYAVKVSADGDIYVGGYIYGLASYSLGNSVSTAGASDVKNLFLAKYSADGTAQWARSVVSIDTAAQCAVTGIAISGNYLYASGYLGAGSTFYLSGTASLTSGGNSTNGVILKYDLDGTYQGGSTTETTSATSCFQAIAADEDGSVWIAGYGAGGISTTQVTVDFGDSVTVGGPASTDLFVVHYSAGCSPLAAWTVSTGSGESYGYGIALDSAGNIYVAGSVWGSAEMGFGNGVTTDGGYYYDNALVVKYAPDGTAQWARVAETAGNKNYFIGVAVNSSGKVFTSGWQTDGSETVLGGISVTSTATSYNNLLIACLK